MNDKILDKERSEELIKFGELWYHMQAQGVAEKQANDEKVAREEAERQAALKKVEDKDAAEKQANDE